MTCDGDLTYGRYLRLDELLSCQHPLTDSHDELLFVIIHQAYELWFKQVLHEAALLQQRLEDGDSAGSLATARRIAKILKTVVGQFDILETMTPRQFAGFRPELGSSSGFQSSQFRYIEAVFGRRDFSPARTDPVLGTIVGRRPVFASLLRYLRSAGFQVPGEILDRDPRAGWVSDDRVQALLAEVYAAAGNTAPGNTASGNTASGNTASRGTPSGSIASGNAAEVCEALVDIDEGLQEWRYRHVKMVERIIGTRTGTGGSAGAAYLRGTLFRPAFPDLWEIRSRA
jgi:tryptophan 2,3-dioxygenase